MTYSAHDKESLLKIAADSIRQGIDLGKPLEPLIPNYSEALQQPRACFVTLMKDGELRGCIGSLEATQALLCDVAKNAFQAAFHDPRFTPVSSEELDHIKIKISVLSPPEDFAVASEADLLEKMRPHIDGVIIEEGFKRSTFLPAVWESLPNPKDFLQHLKRKAGFADHYWSDHIKVRRYTSEDF